MELAEAFVTIRQDVSQYRGDMERTRSMTRGHVDDLNRSMMGIRRTLISGGVVWALRMVTSEVAQWVRYASQDNQGLARSIAATTEEVQKLKGTLGSGLARGFGLEQFNDDLTRSAQRSQSVAESTGEYYGRRLRQARGVPRSWWGLLTAGGGAVGAAGAGITQLVTGGRFGQDWMSRSITQMKSGYQGWERGMEDMLLMRPRVRSGGKPQPKETPSTQNMLPGEGVGGTGAFGVPRVPVQSRPEPQAPQPQSRRIYRGLPLTEPVAFSAQDGDMGGRRYSRAYMRAAVPEAPAPARGADDQKQADIFQGMQRSLDQIAINTAKPNGLQE